MDGTTSRRAFVAGVGTTIASTGVGLASAQSGDYGGWLSDTSNYNGETVDATGQSEVVVSVGVQANGGAFGFGPPAVEVDPGTTVVWQWTGEGGGHNVVDDDTGYESPLVEAPGTEYRLTFESAGSSLYYCAPHQSLGMKGVIVVGNGEGTPDVTNGTAVTPTPGGDGGVDDGSGEGDESAAEGPDLPSTAPLYAVSLVLMALSPLAFLALMAARYRGQGGPPE